jgi:hypothetical protein
MLINYGDDVEWFSSFSFTDSLLSSFADVTELIFEWDIMHSHTMLNEVIKIEANLTLDWKDLFNVMKNMN